MQSPDVQALTESATRPLIGIDATVLASGHGIRGIGRYVGGLLSALACERPDWLAGPLSTLVVAGQTPLTATSWRTRRASIRPHDLDIILARAFDARAVGRRRPRVWHHTDPSIPWSPLPKNRTLVTVYDLIPLDEPELLARMRPHRRLAYRRYLRLIQQAAGVVAISETTARQVIRRLDVPRERILVVPPYVQLGASRELQITDSAAPDAEGTIGEPTFLFVGIPEPHKRPELAIDSFAEYVTLGCPGRLVFVGYHPAGTRRILMKRAAHLGMERRTQFLDRVGDGALRELYAGATLLALSRVEGFGLPPAEALLAGGRVVATPCEAYDEVLGGGAVRSADATPRSIAAAMVAALNRTPDPGAAATITNRFGAHSVATALIEAYEWILRQ